MAQSLLYLQKNNNIFFLLVGFNLIIRFILSSITLGGGDLFNVYGFYLFTLNQYDYYSLFDVNKAPPPYLPFSKLIYLLYGNISEYLNVSFNFILKFSASIFDFFIGLIILKYLKQKNVKNYEYIFLLYIFNPLTLYITTQLGFNDSLTILLLLYCCYLYDLKKCNYNLLAICLTLSFCVKPFTIIFFPFFFLNAKKKISFIIIILFGILFFNFFYLINTEFSRILELFKHIYLKIKTGHQLSSHGLGLIAKNIDIYGLGFSYLKISKIILIIIFIYLYLFFSKKINSIKFVYFIFFSIFIFMPNIHWQYFVWVVPFMFLFKFNIRTLMFSISFLILSFIYSLKKADEANEAGLYILSFFNSFNDSNFLTKYLFDNNQIILILIFYFSLIINCKISFKTLLRYSKKILNSKKKLSFFDAKDQICLSNNFNPIYIFLIVLTIFYASKFNFLKNSNQPIKSEFYENEIVNNFILPRNISKLNEYGEKKVISLNIKFKEIDDDIQKKYISLLINTDYFYEILYLNKFYYSNFGSEFKKNNGGEKFFFTNRKEYTFKIEEKNLKVDIFFNQFKINTSSKINIKIFDDFNKIDFENTELVCSETLADYNCNINNQNEIEIFFNSENLGFFNNKLLILVLFILISIIQFMIFYKGKTYFYK